MTRVPLEPRGLDYTAREDAIEIASNVDLRWPGRMQARPGAPLANASAAVATVWHGLTPTDDEVIVWSENLGTWTLRLTDGTALTSPPAFQSPIVYSADGAQYAYARVRNATILATNQGLWAKRSGSDSYVRAGVQPPPACWVALISVVAGATFTLANGSAVAYRAVRVRSFGDVVSRSAPTARCVIINTLGSARTPAVSVFLPQDTIAGDTIEIYRSPVTISPTLPGDECVLVRSFVVSSADITAGAISYSDRTPEPGAALYTNPSRDSIARANALPPLANVIASYRDMVFAGNLMEPTTRLLSLTRIATPGSDEDAWGYRSVAALTITGTLITGFANTNNIVVGQAVWQGAQVPGPAGTAGTNIAANTYVVSKTATTVTVSVAAVLNGAGLTLNFSDWFSWSGGSASTDRLYAFTGTQRYLVDVLTFGAVARAMRLLQDIAAMATYEYSLSGTSNSRLSLGVFAAQDGSQPVLRLQQMTVLEGDNATSIVGCPDNAVWIDVGSGQPLSPITTYAERVTNGLAWSRQGDPYAWPIIYRTQVGPPANRIIGLSAVGDALLVFGTLGTWRVYGDGPESLTVELVDADLRVIDHRAVTPATRDTAYALTTRGVVELSASGVVRDIGAPVWDLIRPAFDAAPATRDWTGWYLALDTEQRTLVIVYGDVTAYVWQEATQQWATWVFPDEAYSALFRDTPGDSRIWMTTAGNVRQVAKNASIAAATFYDKTSLITVSSSTLQSTSGRYGIERWTMAYTASVAADMPSVGDTLASAAIVTIESIQPITSTSATATVILVYGSTPTTGNYTAFHGYDCRWRTWPLAIAGAEAPKVLRRVWAKASNSFSQAWLDTRITTEYASQDMDVPGIGDTSIRTFLEPYTSPFPVPAQLRSTVRAYPSDVTMEAGTTGAQAVEIKWRCAQSYLQIVGVSLDVEQVGTEARR